MFIYFVIRYSLDRDKSTKFKFRFQGLTTNMSHEKKTTIPLQLYVRPVKDTQRQRNAPAQFGLLYEIKLTLDTGTFLEVRRSVNGVSKDSTSGCGGQYCQ